MKQINKFAAIGFVLMTTFLSNAHAELEEIKEDEPRHFTEQTSTRKLGRGLGNAFFGILEIPKGIEDVKNDKGWVAGASWGLVEGTAQAAKRIGTGIHDIATFYHPSEPLMKPEFVLSNSRPQMPTLDEDRLLY